jgi:hypothetical protein
MILRTKYAESPPDERDCQEIDFHLEVFYFAVAAEAGTPGFQSLAIAPAPSGGRFEEAKGLDTLLKAGLTLPGLGRRIGAPRRLGNRRTVTGGVPAMRVHRWSAAGAGFRVAPLASAE